MSSYLKQRAAIKKAEKRIARKLKGYVDYFYSICYFDEKELDWNIISQKEFNRLKGKWIKYCNLNNYTDKEIRSLFHWDCMLLKTDLIMQVKYGEVANELELLVYLKKGMTPLEVADYAKKNLTLTKVEK